MDRKFEFKVPKQRINEFKNKYGTWTVNICSIKSDVFGFMSLKPVFEIDSSLIKQIKVKFTFVETQYRRYYNFDYVKDAIVDEKILLFYFTPFQINKPGCRTYKIDVKITMPQIAVPLNVQIPSKIETGSSKRHLSELFNTGKLADITIKSQSKELKVHKFILVRSNVFEKMINNPETQESQTGIIEINDIKHEVLYEMFRYLYTDEIPEIKNMALELLIAADKYNIPELAAKCGQYLMENMAAEGFYDVLVVADKLNIKKLKNTAIDYIIENRETILSSEGWKNLKQNYTQLALEVSEKHLANS